MSRFPKVFNCPVSQLVASTLKILSARRMPSNEINFEIRMRKGAAVTNEVKSTNSSALPERVPALATKLTALVKKSRAKKVLSSANSLRGRKGFEAKQLALAYLNGLARNLKTPLPQEPDLSAS